MVVMMVPAKKTELAMSQLVDSVEALRSIPTIPELQAVTTAFISSITSSLVRQG